MSYSLRNSIVLGSLLVLVIVLGGYWVGVRQVEQLTQLGETHAAYKATLQEMTATLADHDASRQELESLVKRWQTRSQVIPSIDSPARTLDYIDRLRDQYGGAISYNFHFKGRRDGPGHSVNRYILEGEAGFSTLHQILHHLEHGWRFVTVDALTIDYQDRPERGDRWSWVTFRVVFRSFFEPGSRIADLGDPPAALAQRSGRTGNPFYPLITQGLPENAGGLFESEGARLTALSKDIAFLVEKSGKSVFLREGDLVFMGRLDRIDLDNNRVEFVLNKGGIWKRLVLGVEMTNGQK